MNIINAEEARRLSDDSFERQEEVRRTLESLNFEIRKAAKNGFIEITYCFDFEFDETFNKVSEILEKAGYTVEETGEGDYVINWEKD
ncbi:MAG: hypothetical protein KBT46_00410 [Ruminococcus sp.]|nr:hypothetical protein [Candidatus Copronaster equi]